MIKTITNLPQFIHSHLNILKAYHPNQTYIATLKLLKYIENLLTSISEAKK
jgi:hypothetical protein